MALLLAKSRARESVQILLKACVSVMWKQSIFLRNFSFIQALHHNVRILKSLTEIFQDRRL